MTRAPLMQPEDFRRLWPLAVASVKGRRTWVNAHEALKTLGGENTPHALSTVRSYAAAAGFPAPAEMLVSVSINRTERRVPWVGPDEPEGAIEGDVWIRG